MNRAAYYSVAVALVVVWTVTGRAPADKAPTIQLSRKADPKATFDVTGLDAAALANLAKVKWEAAQWTALFAVYVDNGTKGQPKDQLAMLGSYRVEAGVLRFEPRFELALGVRYRAVFNPARLPDAAGKREPVVAEFTLPKPQPTTATVVEHIYPTRNKLPENQLKFYLHFSGPMSLGQAYDRIAILNEAGKKIESAFLELGEELWNPEGKRFTLYIDPGRIKRGLKPREDLGPVLEEGKSYTLVIDAKWTDADGNPLKGEYRKKFSVGPPDDEPIDEKKWKLQPLPADGVKPLVVTFPEPLDHALLHRLLWITDAKGQKVAGKVAVSAEETVWQFTPEKAWAAGTYQLLADTTLEDLAGNRIGEPFEVDVFRPIQRDLKTKTVQVSFQVR